MRSIDVAACSVEQRLAAGMRHCVGQVCGLYPNSLTIRYPGPSGLVTVLNPTRDMAPASLSLHEPVPFQACGVSLGSPVVFGGGLIKAGVLTVDTSRARRECCDAPLVRASVETIECSLERLGAALGKRRVRFCQTFDERVADALEEYAHKLERALLLGAEVESALDGLVGFGPGLTPSGDDYLTGLLAALRMLGEPGDRRIKSLAKPLIPRLARTTEVSRWMLAYAIGGRLRQSLIDFVRSCADGGCIEESAEALWAVGASSGFEMSRGIASGLRICRSAEGGYLWRNTSVCGKTPTMIQ